MAESLKECLNQDVVVRTAARIGAVWSGFAQQAFVEQCQGLEALELMERGRWIAKALAVHLPVDFEHGAQILTQALGPPLTQTTGNGLVVFEYLPWGMYIEAHGLEYPEASLDFLREMTKRFTAEFALRVFWNQRPEWTYERMLKWTVDPCEHVRRAASEGARPRLPWAQRLPEMQKDPSKVLDLARILRDDPSDYVRRSVANALNDVGKDHPELLVELARQWWVEAPPLRQRLVHHALRTLIKKSHVGALEVVGFAGQVSWQLGHVVLAPSSPQMGESVHIQVEVHNPSAQSVDALVDLKIDFVKAGGKTSAKVFKMRKSTLQAKETQVFAKTISLADLTTRRHYPGWHRVCLQINGMAFELGGFELRSRHPVAVGSI